MVEDGEDGFGGKLPTAAGLFFNYSSSFHSSVKS